MKWKFIDFITPCIFKFASIQKKKVINLNINAYDILEK